MKSDPNGTKIAIFSQKLTKNRPAAGCFAPRLEYEGVFLTKLNSIIIPGENADTPTFVINEDDGASFAPEDIILKLPAPIVVGGTARRRSQLRFDFDSKKIDLA